MQGRQGREKKEMGKEAEAKGGLGSEWECGRLPNTGLVSEQRGVHWESEGDCDCRGVSP